GVVVCISASAGLSIISNRVVAEGEGRRTVSFVTVISRGCRAGVAHKIDHVRGIEWLRAVVAATIARQQSHVRDERDFAGGGAGEVDRPRCVSGRQRRAGSSGSFLNQEVMAGKNGSRC